MAKKKNMKKAIKGIKVWMPLLVAIAAAMLAYTTQPSNETYLSVDEVPPYSGTAYVEINGNEPLFDEADGQADTFETYSPLDYLGRCGVAYAKIGQELMPTEARESIGHIKPTGWQSVKYDHVDGGSLYNRCHLIGFQLAGENANERNLITGTRYLNVEGMLPFENMLADYVKETGNHVLYRVTPIFEGTNLVANGVEMEGWSVEDAGEAICFHVFAYNVQPRITIDYATGDNAQSGEQLPAGTGPNGANSQTGTSQGNTDNETGTNETNADAGTEEVEIRGNSRSKAYHCPGQSAYEDMADSKYLVIFSSEEAAIDAGYHKVQQ